MTDKTEPAVDQQSKPWQFKAGQSGNPSGRKLGSRNRLGEDFLKALHADFDEHGVEAIQKVRETDTTAYLKIVASILPKEIKVSQNELGDISGDELDALSGLIDLARSQLAGKADSSDRSGEATPARH